LDDGEGPVDELSALLIPGGGGRVFELA
jgi:hypothetical protein